MITSYEAGYKLLDPTPRSSLSMLTVTTLSRSDITWQDMVHAFKASFNHVALLIFDESITSRRIKHAISERYMDLDRVTGNVLLVLSTIPPPKDCFNLEIGGLYAYLGGHVSLVFSGSKQYNPYEYGVSK